MLAKQLASLGAKLIISARNEVELQRVKEQLTGLAFDYSICMNVVDFITCFLSLVYFDAKTGKYAPDEVVILPLDLSRGEEHLAVAVQKAESLFGGAGVDYVFHNAAFERPVSIC